MKPVGKYSALLEIGESYRGRNWVDYMLTSFEKHAPLNLMVQMRPGFSCCTLFYWDHCLAASVSYSTSIQKNSLGKDKKVNNLFLIRYFKEKLL